jgi:hypothetical protein
VAIRIASRSAPKSWLTAIKLETILSASCQPRNVTFPDGRKLFHGSTGTGAPDENSFATDKASQIGTSGNNK